MEIHLIEGHFNANDALDIITQMIHVKIKYHENKINKDSDESDMKARESKIKSLQKELFELRKLLNSQSASVKLSSVIHIDF